jgi:hypothetical protein
MKSKERTCTAAATRMAHRVEHLEDQPHALARRLLTGLSNWCSRNPCAAWSSTTSKPARTARFAAAWGAAVSAGIAAPARA